MSRRAIITAAVAWVALLADPGAPGAETFEETLARVDRALQRNPQRASQELLLSCRSRRNFAVRLYDSGMLPRAERSLKYCLGALGLSETPVSAAPVQKGPSMEEIQAKAALEVERASTLTPDIANGLEIYRSCAMCHTPEGWGLTSGVVPQIAGQHRSVVIKQLADFRAGNRDSVLMIPYASVESIGGPQAVADVAGYIDTLELSADSGKGPGDDLERGQQLYAENCARCHGATGEGSAEEAVPRIQAQHFNYLVRQFEWIRTGKRRNSSHEMVAQIQGFEPGETRAVLDYVSRLEPPEELQAPAGWQNPDFAGQRPFGR